MTEIQNPQVGPRQVSDGAESRLRSERTGGLVVQQAHAPYAEDALRGAAWTISTPVAGILVTALMVVSTASAIPLVGLYNPSGSGVNLIVQRAICLQVTGSAVNFVWGAANNPEMDSSDGVSTAVKNDTFAAGGHTGRAFAGATAMVGTPAIYRMIGGIGNDVVVEDAVGTSFRDDVDGEITIKQGHFAGVFGAVAAATGRVICSLSWAEQPA